MLPLVLLLVAVSGCDVVFRLDKVPAPDAPPPIVGRWVDVTAGLAHTCALDESRLLWCWGRNASGEIGVSSSVIEVDVPRQVTEATWTRISAHNATNCGIQDDGSLWCWGANTYGEVGIGASSLSVRAPTQIDPGPWLDVSAGFDHTCAVRGDHTLWCWGFNDRGQLGDGTQLRRPSPIQVGVDANWEQVAAGSTSTCAIASDQTLWCWGGNMAGQLGISTQVSTIELVPRQVSTSSWTQVSVGRSFACGITAGGELRCWGLNVDGQLGDGSTSSRGMPGPVLLGADDRTDWIDVTTGDAHACAISRMGGTWCWGTSARDQVGVDATPIVATPVQLAGAEPWIAISAGADHTCAVARDHTLWCLGGDGYAQLGDGGTTALEPVRVPGVWKSAALGASHTCAIGDGDAVSCAGLNTGSQLGIGGIDRQDLTPLGMSFTKLAAGGTHTCGIASNETWCWGANGSDQIGHNSPSNALAPVHIRAGTAVGASNHTCSIDPSSQHLFCWGENNYGQVGNKPASTGPAPPVVTVAMPFEILSLTWRAADNGSDHTCAIGTNNMVSCWGHNGHGQLGNGSTTNVIDPAAAMTAVVADQLSVGGFHACAITTAGVASCWGADYFGQLGIGGGFGSRATPQIVPGTWFTISAGYEYTCGIKAADRTLWCWGENDRGQLGIGTRVNATTPTQVGTDGGWDTVATGQRHTCATKMADGSLWCWGDNADGQLANGAAWTPMLVQVP